MSQGQSTADSGQDVRLRVAIRGAVQGVGFRPFVFRLASELRLVGTVNNCSQGVLVEVEGPKASLERFLFRLEAEKPARSFIQSLECSWLDRIGYTNFAIRDSDASGLKTAFVLPDIATCADCLQEIFDPTNLRYFYPFTNCTHCGPRFSIIEALPYDRANTSMNRFSMCSLCASEYDHPMNRRFHAQPNACPVCGPHLEIWDGQGRANAVKATTGFDLEFSGAVEKRIGIGRASALMPEPNQRNARALEDAVHALRIGKIVAVKGLGGFHLMVAAHHESAVRRLRDLKHREEKPFALMFPSLAAIKTVCQVSAGEERLLRSSEAPIVLVRATQRDSTDPRMCVSPSVAPNNPFFGVMLPYTPLHHLLLLLFGFPVVATSGNLSDEPICTDEHEALERLGGIADLFLVHNRPIVRHVDDSIVRIVAGREQVVRRARGYAPLPIQLQEAQSNKESILAVGGHLKNTIALSVGAQVFISQHIGDLENDQADCAFRHVIADFEILYEHKPTTVAADAHPDYLSTKFARAVCAGGEISGSAVAPDKSSPGPRLRRPCYISVQHHLAHVLSCMAENEVPAPALGIAFDGAGYGLDGTVWGGEFLRLREKSWNRVAHFRQFRLPGGDVAIKEPRRTALGVLYELMGQDLFSNHTLAPVVSFSRPELVLLQTMLERGVNAPFTSSVGRLFDAVASLAGIRQTVRFEGQAAMELEFAMGELETEECYPIKLVISGVGLEGPTSERTGKAHEVGDGDSEVVLHLDWSTLIQGLVADLASQTAVGLISARFHNALVEAMIKVSRHFDMERVVLSGGCFQNKYLLERAVQRLRESGFRPYWHQRVPTNDGGICLGQVLAAMRELRAAPSRENIRPLKTG